MNVTLTCRHCGRPFTPKTAHAATISLYCSRACGNRAYNIAARGEPRAFPCSVCAVQVTTYHPRQATCLSAECKREHVRLRRAPNVYRDAPPAKPRCRDGTIDVLATSRGTCTRALRTGPCHESSCKHHVPHDHDSTAGCALFSAWYHQGMTLAEVSRALGVTRERVRQIESKALAKMRNAAARKA